MKGKNETESDQPGTPRSSEPSIDFVRRVLAVVAIVIVAAVLIWLLAVSIHTWLEVFAGILLAVLLRGMSDWISARTRISPGWSLAVTIFLLTGIIAVAVLLLAPDATRQFKELADQLPKAVMQFRERLRGARWFQFVIERLPAAPEMGGTGGKALDKVGALFSGSFEAITGLVLILFLGLYLAATPKPYVRGLLHLFPLSRRPRIHEALGELATTLRHWILGQLLSMCVVGILIGVGLKFIGIPLPIALGILAGVFDFVPIIGPLFSAVPAVLFAFLIDPWHALYVVILFLIVNTVIESHLLVPLIQRYTVSLPPALTIVSMVLLGTLFGFLGVLLATPLTASALVLVRLFYVEDVLHDASLAPKTPPSGIGRGQKKSI